MPTGMGDLSLAQLSGILPEGFQLPPLVYLVPLVVLLAGAVALLYAIRPPVTDWTAPALAPWVATGGVLYVLYQQPAFAEVVRPLFNNPTVYLTTATVTGYVWVTATIVAGMRGPHASVDRQLGTVGASVLVVFVAYSLWISGSILAFWPVVALALAVVAATLAWIGLSLAFTNVAATTARTGALVVFGHALDGVSTAVGVDVLGVAERTPLSRAVMDVAAQLPTAEIAGVGWLFLLVKLLLALLVVGAFNEYVKTDPAPARILLLVVAAVGLGPGVHNVLLFTIRGSTGAV